MRDENKQNESSLKRRRKRRRLKRNIMFLFLLMFLAVGYAFFQYQQGMKSARDGANIDWEEYEFYGEKDQYGGINVLLIGSDTRGEKQARSDTIMVAQYHPQKQSYKLISIMRDTYVDIPNYGKNRINAAFALGGPELLRKTIKENFNLDIQYYAIIDFEGFVRLVDEAFPKGVKIEVEKPMSDYIDVMLEPGIQYLDGEHLLGYVRFRNDAMGDFNRVMRQQKVMQEIAAQFTSVQTLSKFPKLIGLIQPYVNTNMDTSNIIYIGKDYLSKNRREIDTMRIPIEGGYRPERVEVGEVLRMDLPTNVEAVKRFLEK